MRSSIATKLSTASGLVMLALVLIALFVIRETSRIESHLEAVTSIQEPLRHCASELEINTVEVGLNTLRFLANAEPQYREKVKVDAAQFRSFKARFDGLAASPRLRELGRRIDAGFETYLESARTLMDLRQREMLLADEAARAFEEIDRILDEEIQVRFDPAAPGAVEKLRACYEMEINIAEVGTWLGHDLRFSRPAHRQRIEDGQQDFRIHLGEFLKLPLREEERRMGLQLKSRFHHTLDTIAQVIAMAEQVEAETKRLSRLRQELDDILDEGIQVLAEGELETANREAHGSIRKARWAILSMLGVGLLGGLGGAMLISRRIAASVRALTQGVQALCRAEKGPIHLKTGDELETLAEAFNTCSSLQQRSEANLIQANEELVQANQALVLAKLEAEEAAGIARGASLAKSTFLATMSHELRTPLNAVILYSELVAEVARDAGNQALVADVGKIRAAAGRLLLLIDDILELSSVEAGFAELHTVPFHPARLVEALVQSFENHAQQKGISLLCRVPAEPVPQLLGDVPRLSKVLHSLLDNAVKFTLAGEVEANLHLEPSPGEALLCRFEVRDTGIGIPEQARERIFEAFYQADGSPSRSFEGTGLGLALSWRLVKELGGRLDCESTEGKGSSFTLCITLPVSR